MDINMRRLLNSFIDGHKRTIETLRSQINDFEELLIADENQRASEESDYENNPDFECKVV